MQKIRDLAQTPRPAGSKKLQGSTRLWRLRVGDYRVIYEISDDTGTLEIGYVRHRRDVYRDL
jgi:mRNA interferase RelE/StbE